MTTKTSLQAGDQILTNLDTYSVEEPIGEGTFSVVFKARSRQSKQVVAAKILKDGQSDYTRITKEFRCLAALKGHENVVEVLDGNSDGCRITLIMPYFEHDDFGQKLQEGAFTDKHISNYLSGLFAALVHVHGAGFIHRDIKPTNVLYNFEKRRTLVVDFGLVQVREEASPPRGVRSGGEQCNSTRVRPRQAASMDSPLDAGNSGTSGSIQPSGADSGSTAASGRRAARPLPAALPGFRAPPGHLFGGVGHLQTLLARREGTRGFRAPEVLMQCEAQNTAIDVWSAGIILLCLLTQRYPIFEAIDDQHALREICVLLGDNECASTAGYDVHLFPVNNHPPSGKSPAPHDLATLLKALEIESHWIELATTCLRFDPKQRSSAKKAHEKLTRLRTIVDA